MRTVRVFVVFVVVAGNEAELSVVVVVVVLVSVVLVSVVLVSVVGAGSAVGGVVGAGWVAVVDVDGTC